MCACVCVCMCVCGGACVRLFPKKPLVDPGTWIREEHADRMWSAFGPGYDTFSPTHTARYGYPIGHPERNYDVVPDTRVGGYQIVANRDIAKRDNITWCFLHRIHSRSSC